MDFSQLIRTADRRAILFHRFPVRAIERIEACQSQELVDDIIARQLGRQVRRGGNELIGLFIDFRFLVFDPQDLGHDIGGTQRSAIPRTDLFLTIHFRELFHFISRSGIDAVEDGFS